MIINQLKRVSDNYSELHNKVYNHGFPRNTKQHLLRTIVDWSTISHYEFIYEYVGNEDVGCFLQKSIIFENYKNILLDLSPDGGIISIDTSIFVRHWEEFVREIQSLGFMGLSEDYKYIFEFTDRSEYKCYSNFEIKPNTFIKL